MPEKNRDNDLEKELSFWKALEVRIKDELSTSSIPEVNVKLNLLIETVADTWENFTLSKHTDAKMGHKSADSSFFRYNTHLAITEECFITAAGVTSGEKGDGSELPKFLEISKQNCITVGTIIENAVYLGKKNLRLTSEQNIQCLF